MRKNELIKRLQKIKGDPEVMIQELACENVRLASTVNLKWYIDDGVDAPEAIDETEDPKDYDIDPDEEKVVVIE